MRNIEKKSAAHIDKFNKFHISLACMMACMRYKRVPKMQNILVMPLFNQSLASSNFDKVASSQIVKF